MTNEGGPAFPQAFDKNDDYDLTLRDWLAGQALLGLLAYSGAENVAGGPAYKAIARMAYELADAMLDHRETE